MVATFLPYGYGCYCIWELFAMTHCDSNQEVMNNFFVAPSIYNTRPFNPHIDFCIQGLKKSKPASNLHLKVVPNSSQFSKYRKMHLFF
jgi:hypothetical protein